MGSASDWSTMSKAVEVLQQFGVEPHVQVLSAHRMPDEMFAFAEAAERRGLRAIIAGAGGAAHLPGMLAAKTIVPVLGVPVPSRHLGGQDILYSIVQMPAGVPVATFAIGEAGATNAALFAVALLAADDPALADGARRRTAARVTTTPPPAPCRPHEPTPTRRSPSIAPPATLGILGGGQLGRYFVIAARTMGYRTMVLEPDPHAPAGAVADVHLVAAYDDPTRARPSWPASARWSPPSSRTPRQRRCTSSPSRTLVRPSPDRDRDHPGPPRREALPRRASASPSRRSR